MDFVIGIDLGHRNVPAAERWVHSVIAPVADPSSLIACTHVISRPYPHVAISIVGSGSPQVHRHLATLMDGQDDGTAPVGPVTGCQRKALSRHADRAVDDHVRRRSGRAVIYPGIERMTGLLSVEEVVAASAIDRVTVLDGSPPGSAEPPPDAKLDTRDHVRPHWSYGLLTLLVIPTETGDLVPFEAPYPGVTVPRTASRPAS